MLTITELQTDNEIQTLLKFSDMQLESMGYTDHGERHRLVVVQRTADILAAAGASKHDVALGKIAAYLHDVGCAVNRSLHGHSSALIMYPLLLERGLNVTDAVLVCNAMANHDEKTGNPATTVAAALVLADKSDVHRTRVRPDKMDAVGLLNEGDIHDRVNYSVIDSRLDIDKRKKKIFFRFVLDSAVSSPMEYFEIFLGRMKMCQQAALVLGYEFNLEINKQLLA
jgi:HD superfamily phosphodiesterase